MISKYSTIRLSDNEVRSSFRFFLDLKNSSDKYLISHSIPWFYTKKFTSMEPKKIILTKRTIFMKFSQIFQYLWNHLHILVDSERAWDLKCAKLCSVRKFYENQRSVKDYRYRRMVTEFFCPWSRGHLVSIGTDLWCQKLPVRMIPRKGYVHWPPKSCWDIFFEAIWEARYIKITHEIVRVISQIELKLRQNIIEQNEKMEVCCAARGWQFECLIFRIWMS